MKEAGHSYVETQRRSMRSDIKFLGFWSNMRQAFFDVKVVSPLARSYCHMPILDLLKMAEKAKCREYRQRILEVEHGDFNPLVFTTSCALGPPRYCCFERIAEKMSERQSISRSVIA